MLFPLWPFPISRETSPPTALYHYRAEKMEEPGLYQMSYSDSDFLAAPYFSGTWKGHCSKSYKQMILATEQANRCGAIISGTLATVCNSASKTNALSGLGRVNSPCRCTTPDTLRYDQDNLDCRKGTHSMVKSRLTKDGKNEKMKKNQGLLPASPFSLPSSFLLHASAFDIEAPKRR